MHTWLDYFTLHVPPAALPVLSYSSSVFPSPADSMSDETFETPPTGPQHIGQLDEPRELLNVVDQAHATG